MSVLLCGLSTLFRLALILGLSAYADVTQLVLINAETGAEVAVLRDGSLIDLAVSGRNLNVRADVKGPAAAVRFGLDGKVDYRMEKSAPFALAGDSNGIYNRWTPAVGRHTVTATALGEGGRDGKPLSVQFQVIEGVAEKPRAVAQAGTDGDGTVVVSGELRLWHKVTVDLQGPWCSETGSPNPFLDYRMDVTFTHESGTPSYLVPGYFAADGNAAETSAEAGAVWRAHLSPDKIGRWTYRIAFHRGAGVAVNGGGTAFTPYDGKTGSFTVAATDKTGRDFRGKGRLDYVGGHYLRFAGTGEYFLKQGADAPENLLAYDDFDNTTHIKKLRKSWAPHVRDWRDGDPTWQGGKGKGLIGAVNYLASEGMNAMSFLTDSAHGDDKNVYMWRTDSDYQHYDVSKCAQWEIVFSHMTRQGMYLHVKTQETENDQDLDGGALGVNRKLYYRELIARFGHHLALNWNLGEENTNTDAQRQAFAQYFHDNDPYRHNVVLHTFPGQKELVYTPMLGDNSKLTGLSLQTSNAAFTEVHRDVLTWVSRSAEAGKPWVVACDEPGDAQHALRPDNDAGNSHEDGRRNALWGTLLAGGCGNEWYFGYGHAESDLTLQDFRSRDKWWDYCRVALAFFADNQIPFWEMRSGDALSTNANSYCFHKPDALYLVYLKNGGTAELDLTAANGNFDIAWYDPRSGGALQAGRVRQVQGGGQRSLGMAPNAPDLDWLVVVRKSEEGK